MSDSPLISRIDVPFKKFSLSFLAGTFVVLVCLSLVAVVAMQIWSERTVQLRETETSASNLAKAVAQHAYDTFKEADTVLIGLVERLEAEDLSDGHLARLHKLLVHRVGQLPQLHGLFVYGDDGHWIVNSQQATASVLVNSDREYFIYHRDHADRAPHIGPPIQSKSTGEWIVTVSRRFNHPDGSFAGVALATIRMDYFRKFYESFDIGNNGAIFVATSNAVLLLRRPFDEKILGKDLTALPLFHNYLPTSRSGTITLKSGIDGITRINSYRQLDTYPLVISAALSKDEALASWRSDAYWHGGAVGILVVGLGLLGFWLIKQIARRTKAEAELVQARNSLEALNATLEKLALQDGLTGLANRRQFDIVLKDELSRAIRNASSLALIMIDVDYFKQYNDIYGHAAGDECLREIGKIVAAGKNRPGDLSARYGGEEMAVLLPGADVQGALIVAEKIRQTIHDLELKHAGNAVGIVTVSAGVQALVPDRETQPVELIEAADKALYKAKQLGRNRVCAKAEEAQG